MTANTVGPPRDPAPHERTAYDEVPYPGFPYAQTHPDRLATLATLFGMSPAPVDRCRVLELGCGDGGNLVPMAYELPDSAFVGIDLAQTAITRARALVDVLELKNVDLICGDLSEVGAEFGEFDFIVAHGVYSWVAETVRDRLLEVCRANLAPDGVAFVSYNALPGGYVRLMLRDMMLFETRGVTSPQARVTRARHLLKVLAEAGAASVGYQQLVAEQLERTAAQSDVAILHDHLAAINRATYFHEFVDHAAAHDLQYLAEADFFEMHAAVSSPEVVAALDEHGDDVLAREQYLDFLKCRMYRQTLLCRFEIPLERRLNAERVTRFLLASPARPATPDAVLGDRSLVEFHGPHGAALRTDEPIIKLALERLGASWPRRVPFAELLQHARAAATRHNLEQRSRGDDTRVLGESLLRAYAANLVQLHVHQPRFAAAPGERPRVSALARLQARRGDTVTTLRHVTIRIDDPDGRRLLTLLDGSHDRATLVDVMFSDAANRHESHAKLESKLEELAALALLEQ